MPRDFNLNDLEAASFTLAWKEGAFVPKDPALAAFPLTLDQPPDIAAVGRMVQRVGRASKEAARVEVPFEYIAPKPGDEWKGDAGKGFDRRDESLHCHIGQRLHLGLAPREKRRARRWRLGAQPTYDIGRRR